MGKEVLLLQLLLAGLQAGLLLSIALALASARLRPAVRICAVLAAVSLAVNVLANSGFRELFGPWGAPHRRALLTFGFLGMGFAWVAMIGLFEDRRIGPWMFAPTGVLLTCSLAMHLTAGPPEVVALWIGNMISTALALHVLYILARGHAGDLVESRRRLRRPLLLACLLAGAALLLQQAITLPPWGELSAGVYHAVDAVLLGGIGAMAAALIQLRWTWFEARAARPPADDRPSLEALTRLMAEGETWRREGLSIGALAAELDLPEHRLRRLINDTLGHRNFRAFVNSYRIEAAKRRLSDPEDGATVAEIAFDLGFISLSPFNRAFKEATGVTPTQWRRGTDGK